MSIDTPRILILCLLATTVLGGVMGYCIALIRAKKNVDVAIETESKKLATDNEANAVDLRSARLSIEDLRETLGDANKRADMAMKREEALDVHSQLQAQRIQTLESQISSYEDQQIKLQRDFASYKSNKSRELELARNKPDSWSQADQLPVLKKRIDEVADNKVPTQPNIEKRASAEAMSSMLLSGGNPERARLSIPLSRELEIPSLSESELPDSVDELEFEMTDMDSTGAWSRG